MTEFVFGARAEDVAEGEVVAAPVAGKEIAIACVDGAYYAFDNECTHRGCFLADGELEGGSVVCPCHGGEFDLATGEVLSGPPRDPVETYPVRLVDGIVEIGL